MAAWYAACLCMPLSVTGHRSLSFTQYSNCCTVCTYHIGPFIVTCAACITGLKLSAFEVCTAAGEFGINGFVQTAGNTELGPAHNPSRQQVVSSCSVRPQEASHVIISVSADKNNQPSEPAAGSNIFRPFLTAGSATLSHTGFAAFTAAACRCAA